MPELPEVETVRRGIEPFARKKRILKVIIPSDPLGVRTLRRVKSIPAFRKRIVNRTIQEILRRGKYLLFHLDNRDILIIHLGMSGRLLVRRKGDPPDSHTRITFQLEKGLELRLDDPRKFGEVYLFSPPRGETAVNPFKLGVEYYNPGFTAAWLHRELSRSRRPIKAALLDQNLVAGIGNIYSDEILFSAGIKPDRPSSSITKAEAARIVRNTKRILRNAIARRGTTAGDGTYRDSRNRPGTYQKLLKVYARQGEKCSRCRGEIHSAPIGGRTAHFCPCCQK